MFVHHSVSTQPQGVRCWCALLDRVSELSKTRSKLMFFFAGAREVPNTYRIIRARFTQRVVSGPSDQADALRSLSELFRSTIKSSNSKLIFNLLHCASFLRRNHNISPTSAYTVPDGLARCASTLQLSLQ